MKKKIIIVGAGISGLSAGVYAVRSGFDAEIIEQHFTFGGFSTSWKRKGYYFEGGMHWLTGSSPKVPLNRVWKETGALQENNPVENRDPFYTLIDGEKKLRFWRDLNRFKTELLEFAPEDKKNIKKLCSDIKAFRHVNMPMRDVKGLKTKHPCKLTISQALAMLPAGLRYFRLKNTSYLDYIGKFKNETVRHLLLSIVGHRYNALSFIYTMSSIATGDSGFPLGGSIRMAQNMLDTFLSLGGKITYSTKVEKIITEKIIDKNKNEKQKVVAIKTDKGEIKCDSVIVTQDTRVAIDNLFEEKIETDWAPRMRKNVTGSENVFVALGVKADLSHYPYSMVFPLKEKIEFAENEFSELRIYNYAKYSGFAPEGGTSLTCILLAPYYDYWKKAKLDGTYKEKKDALAQKFIEAVSKFIPEVTKESVEVYDVATPLTYERYCSAYQGSWMSIWKPRTSRFHYPQTIKNLEGVYFAGQRIMIPGGLPIAVYTGRRAVQLVCRDNDVEFV